MKTKRKIDKELFSLGLILFIIGVTVLTLSIFLLASVPVRFLIFVSISGIIISLLLIPFGTKIIFDEMTN